MTAPIGFLVLALVFAARPAAAQQPSPEQIKQDIHRSVVSSLPPSEQAAARSKSVEQIAKTIKPAERYAAVGRLTQAANQFKDNPAALAEIASALAALREPKEALRLARAAVETGRQKNDTAAVAVANAVLRLTREESRRRPQERFMGAAPQSLRRAGARFHASVDSAAQNKMTRAIERAGLTETGKNNLVILSDVQFQLPDARSDKGVGSGQIKEIQVDGKRMWGVSIPRDELNGDSEALAAAMSGKLGAVRFYEANDGKVSKISAKTIEFLHTAWTATELAVLRGSRNIACAISDSLCNRVTAFARAWRGDFDTSGLNSENRTIVEDIAEIKSPGTTGAERVESYYFNQLKLDRNEMGATIQPWYAAQRREVREDTKAMDGYIRSKLR